MRNEFIFNLMKLTANKEKDKIKEILEQIPVIIKGRVFEEYIKELYSGNGWIAVRNGSKDDAGADILLYHPKTPDNISIIIQVKNHARPLIFDETKIELIKFEEKSKNKYKCSSYMLISMNGFVKEAEKLEEFSMRLENWSYIEKLIDSFDINGKEEPEIELYSHNKIAYESSKELYRTTNKIAIVQATGTGKSYIIIKYLSDFINKNSLVLAPSKYILNQIKSKASWITQNTILMTYAKLKNLTDEEIQNAKFDFIVLDEFHRCGAEQWGIGVNRLLNCNPTSYVIGTSATPIRYLDDNRDMSDELFDGNVASSLSLPQAIVKKILPMPIYVSALYTLNEELNKIEEKLNNDNIIADREPIKVELLKYKKDWEKSKGIPIVLKKYIHEGANKFIVFCENKEHLSDMEWLLEMWFKKVNPKVRVRKYRVVSGDTTNESELESFKSANNNKEISLLFVIDMLNEGIHIEDISGVILLRNTSSPRIFYQQIGRAIQVGNINKKPLIFDFVNNFQNICANDFLSELNMSKVIEREKRQSLGLDENCPEFTIYDETKDIIEFFKDIEFKLGNIWDYRYEQLVQYYITHGNCMVTRRNENNALAYWVGTQRKFYNNGRLEKERIEKLNKLNFEWGRDEQWVLNFKELIKYKEKFGTVDVLKRYKINDFGLGEWTVWVRNSYKNGELSKKQIDLLNGIGFKWDMRVDRWEEMYEQLKEFKKVNGHCNVSRKIDTDKTKLANWVGAQRALFKKGKLSQNRRDKLIELGFMFEFHDYRNRK